MLKVGRGECKICDQDSSDECFGEVGGSEVKLPSCFAPGRLRYGRSDSQSS